MPQLAQDNRITSSKPRSTSAAAKPFQGFAAPTSNTTYTPNQFFDVCIPRSSRGVVRLVAYVIRKTLGWCDTAGNPQEERIHVSYQDLVDHAGISRDMIRKALDEAVEAHFIRCIRDGRAKGTDDAGETALYELCWDATPEYIKDPKRFRGFFEGEGNRTDIPNQFFDRLIPCEPLAVIKAVGSIIRFSIGFQARRGVRRQLVQLSYSDIQRYARIRSRTTLSKALTSAVSRNYITCLEQGVFDPNAGRLNRAAVYALKWADGFGTMIGQKSGPAQIPGVQDHQSEKWTGHQSEKWTDNGRKSGPEKRSEKWTGIETKQRNEIFKQQPELADDEMQQSLEALQNRGYGLKTARALAAQYPLIRIKQQMEWLGLRTPARNALGMLRRAIEENWPDPAMPTASLDSRGALFAAHFYASLAGNEAAPIAEPSAGDIAAGERYMRRLATVETGELNPAHWGRILGRMLAEDSPALARRGMTLTFALRLHGDTFYLRHQAALHRERLKAERTAREAHENSHQPAWLEYLKIEEQRVKKDRPDDYARFEAHRAVERRRMIESPWAVFIEEWLARYDGTKRRVLDFQKFYSAEVLGFWEWDARMNPTSFNHLTTTP